MVYKGRSYITIVNITYHIHAYSSIHSAYIRGLFGKYVDKCNRTRIKYARRMKFCINAYELLNIKYDQYEKRTPINELDIGH